MEAETLRARVKPIEMENTLGGLRLTYPMTLICALYDRHYKAGGEARREVLL